MFWHVSKPSVLKGLRGSHPVLKEKSWQNGWKVGRRQTAVSKLDWWGWALWFQPNHTFCFTYTLKNCKIFNFVHIWFDNDQSSRSSLFNQVSGKTLLESSSEFVTIEFPCMTRFSWFLKSETFSYNVSGFFSNVLFRRGIGCMLEYELVHVADVEAAVKYAQGAIVCKADAEIPPVKGNQSWNVLHVFVRIAKYIFLNWNIYICCSE